MLIQLKRWALRLKQDVHAIWIAARDVRTPWYVRLLALAVAGYAVSPIDLIPDFLPVIGYLDDIIIVPLGIWLVIRLIPPELLAQCRARAAEMEQRPVSRLAAVVFVILWVVAVLVVVHTLPDSFFPQ